MTPKALEADAESQERRRRTREKLRQQLRDGKLEDRDVEVEVQQQSFPLLEYMQPPQGMEGTDVNITEMLQEMLPKKKKRRTVKVAEARRSLIDEELKKLVDMDDVANEALDRIMTEPENALTKQYAALCATEGATLEFTEDGIREVARIAAKVNERMENIGARRLHTVMSALLEDVLFELPDYPTKQIVFDAAQVRERLSKIVDDEDLRKYIL